jgi:cysteinyl-tRNA synthetase
LNDIKRTDGNNTDIDNIISNYILKFIETVNDDLNIAGGLGVFFDFIHDINSLISEEKLFLPDVKKVLEALKKLDSVFGFIYYTDNAQANIDTDKIESLIKERVEAKAQKNFKRADEIRDTLLKEGIILEDSKDGTRWKIKK